MISLSDEEMATVMQVAAPIDRRERDAFLRAVVDELGKFEVLGPGIVGRVCSRLQRAHLAPRVGHNVGSKYGH